MQQDELWVRQQRLRVRSAQLRISLLDPIQVIQKPLAIADQVQAGLKWLYRHPQWSVGALLFLTILRPRRTLLWGRRAWWAWKTYQRIQKIRSKLITSNLFDHNGIHGKNRTPQ
jgi:YqjK-like protein